MLTQAFNFNVIHPSWKDCFDQSLAEMDPTYLKHLTHSSHWLPGPEKIFSAFSLPLEKVNYVLFGESPYPRQESANGYAFWDASVTDLWSPVGLSKRVNRATSMRNIMKMLLIAEGLLDKKQTNQEAIANISKTSLVHTNDEFFQNLLNHGFLLLNATLVLQEDGSPSKDAKAWHPFMKGLLACLLEKRPNTELILFGRIANTIDTLLPHKDLNKIYAEHPYNHTFITNQAVLDFFKPLHLLRKQ